jgi:hypothetical protein
MKRSDNPEKGAAMLTLHVDPECDKCGRMVERARQNHLAVRVDRRCDHAPPHSMTEGEEHVAGHEEVARRIEERADWRDKSHRISGDYCYDFGDGIEGTGGCG